MKRKLFSSLQSKYMLLICVALILFQFVYLLVSMVFSGISNQTNRDERPDYRKVEQSWHQAAKELTPDSAEAVEQLYEAWAKQFPQAAMFWVNGAGELKSSWNVERELPQTWTAMNTAQYMKSSYGNDPYTVIAFVAGSEQHGFVVIELPRKLFQSMLENVYDRFGTLLLGSVLAIILLFIFISYWFFRSIRKRLLYLQRAMSMRDSDNLPVAIHVRKQDEIGQLEQAFNHMVLELKQSRERELEEEHIRRQLIANLSHDIRTPLTKLRANAYTISKHELPAPVATAAQSMEGSVRQIDELVDNLLAYTLLIGERYRMELKHVAINRFLREHLASWYAAFEQEDFEVEIKLGEMKQPEWMIDPIWMKRILDNLLQNVLRHAKSGKYVAVETTSCEGYDVIRIIDQGNGIDEGKQHSEGAGIGLSIVDMMVKGMGLSWQVYRQAPYFIIEIRKPYQRSGAKHPPVAF
ncbi:hypothetical protein J40TS1_41170 [Paenibacillus montaniterrae]|uniref:histidine kinase n=1 Tax=Paenibacillus montaniterrae TaxID=429341 RepID=A0A919YS70_9BACL|nr:HAMP domain-containing sensor histidine kinase [Paenibacillus montaniterrae]GIP18475.1 hypothetical protein J40TS1_41170 [Paenibacillus montaniterrae]